jgi:hypothetical protein
MTRNLKTSKIRARNSMPSYLATIWPSVIGGAVSWALLLWLVAWMLS